MDRLIRACYVEAGTDPSTVRSRLLAELRRLVPYDAAFFATADPNTLLFTSTYADEPLTEAAPQFLDNEFGEAPDVNRFASLAHADDPTGSIDAATHGSRRDSPRWQDILASLGMGDEARVALRVDDATWGFVCLHRTGPTGFDAKELTILRRAAPHLGAALRRSVTTTTESDTGADTHGIVIIDGDRIAAVGGDGDRWLRDVAGDDVDLGDPAPTALLGLVRHLEALEDGRRVPPPAARFRTGSGDLVTAQATRLNDRDRAGAIAITIAPATPIERQSLLVHAHGLTPAQTRVAELVVRGLTTRQVMQHLRISEHTVQDHLKAVFDKMGVRSRRELITTLTARRRP